MTYAPISIYNNILYAVIIFCKKKKSKVLHFKKAKENPIPNDRTIVLQR